MTPPPDPRRPELVSVLVVARNAESTLSEQLEALARQTYDGAWELVVVDDHSEDRTVEVIAAAPEQLQQRMRFARNPGPTGQAVAHNFAARVASGDLLACCDADDIVTPTWLAEIVSVARRAHQVGGYLETRLLNPGMGGGLPADELPTAHGLRYAVGANMAVWRDAFDDVGGFDEKYRRNQDVVLSVRLADRGYTIAYAPRAIVQYRYRSTARGLARQYFAMGVASVQLYRDHRHRGADAEHEYAVREWRVLITRAPSVMRGTRAERLRWLARVSFRLGGLVGSARYRTWCP